MEEKDNVLRNIVGLDHQDPARGSINDMAESHRFSPDEFYSRKLIYPGMQQRSVLNAFREIRTKLFQKSPVENFVVLVSSITEEGGASFVSMNLGASIAQAEHKTALVIDCNLYDPSLSDTLLPDSDYGLTDYLEDPDLDIDDIIYPTGVPKLRIIPVGSKRDSGVEFFTGERMHRFISSVKKRYPDRYIILDVAPLSDAADARILVDICDLAVLVVPAGKATENQILAGVDTVNPEKLAGIVFNH
jgi:protein-tyrosine kinase